MKVWNTGNIVEEAKAAGKPVAQENIRQLDQRGAMPASKPGWDWLVQDKAAQVWLNKWLSGEPLTAWPAHRSLAGAEYGV
jgi:hypothetical protein